MAGQRGRYTKLTVEVGNLGDWVSLYLSYIREVDTTEVKVIDYLKGELAK